MSNAIVNKDDGKSTLSADESNINDTTALLGKSSTNSNIKPCGDKISPLTIDEMVETLGFGLFHVLIVIITGLCFSGFAIYYQSISVITLAACELDINNHNKLWISFSVVAGITPGATIMGGVGDSIGRRKIILFCVALNIICLIATALAYNYIMMIAIGFVNGFCFGGNVANVHPYTIEFLPRKYRGKAVACLTAFVIFGSFYSSSIGMLILSRPFYVPLGAIYFTHWRLYLLLCTLPLLVAFCGLLLMPNSFRFMLKMKRLDDVHLIIEKVNYINSCCNSSVGLQSSKLTHESLDNLCVAVNNSSMDQNQSNFCQHYRKLCQPPWHKRFFLLAIVWTGFCFSLYVLWQILPTLLSSFLRGKTCWHGIVNVTANNNQYFPSNRSYCPQSHQIVHILTNIMLGNVLSIPVAIACILLIDRLGRKCQFITIVVASSLAILMIVVIDKVMTAKVFIGIFFSFSLNGWISFKIWSSELFPTELRSTALGTCNTLGNIGGLCGLIIFSIQGNCAISLPILASVLLLIGLPSLFLPDTTQADIQ